MIALGGRLEHLTAKMGLIGPEVADSKALNIPLDQAEILVTNKEMVGTELKDLPRHAARRPVAAHQASSAAGVPIPVGLKTKLQRMDICSVGGLKIAVNERGEHAGHASRAPTRRPIC